MIRKNGALKKAAALLLVGAMLCGLAGCDLNGTDSSVPINSSSVSESNFDHESASDEQNTNLIKPEIVMDGQLIALPCKVKDIAGITIDREYSFVVVPASENVDTYSMAYFYYNDLRAGLIRLAGDCSERSDLGDETVVGIDLFDEIPGACLGLTFQSKREDIIDMLGDPDSGGNTVMIYYIGGNPADHIDFDLNSNGKIRAVRIYLGISLIP